MDVLNTLPANAQLSVIPPQCVRQILLCSGQAVADVTPCQCMPAALSLLSQRAAANAPLLQRASCGRSRGRRAASRAMPKEAGKVVQLSTGALLVVFHCFDQLGEQLSIGALCWPSFLRKNLQAAEQFSCAGRNRRAGWCSLRFTTHISQTGDSHTHSPGHTGMLGAHLSSRSQHLPPLLVVSMQATATHAC